ncbi:unnamed protein product [Caenorhabditis brenneri]
MKSTGHHRTEMLLRKQKKEERELKLEREKKTHEAASGALARISLMLEENRNDEELLRNMDLLIPVVIGMFTTSTHWLVRDKALECIRLIHRKMGQPMIDKHLKSAPRHSRILLERLLNE